MKRLFSLFTASLLIACSGNPYVNPDDPDSLLLDQKASKEISSSYHSGNYGRFKAGEIELEYYRALGCLTDALTVLYPFSHPYAASLGGSLYNLTGLESIDKLVLTYSTALSAGGDAPTLYLGSTQYERGLDLSYSMQTKTFTLDSLEDIHYFKIEAGDCALKLISLEVVKNAVGKDKPFMSNPYQEETYRAHPCSYQGELVAGSSVALAPIEAKIEGENYVVTASKEYTYYSLEYVLAHPENKEKAALVDPVDVANYYALFHAFPVNYASKDEYDGRANLFGKKTRLVSTYTRDDGYAQKLPIGRNKDTGMPLYHEFDIALSDDYDSHNRGVGRLVTFDTGIDLESYGRGNDVVSFFSDDHYSTFLEYDNLGSFLPRFSATCRIVNEAWSEPKLVKGT